MSPNAVRTRIWCKRLAWMAAIWTASVAAVGLVSWVLRLWLKP